MGTAVTHALRGLGLPPERVGSLAAAWRMSQCRLLGDAGPDAGPDDAAGARVVVLLGEAFDLGAASAAEWLPPAMAWIEIAGLDDEALRAHVERALRCDLFASLTTATANNVHIAGRFLAALAMRLPLGAEQQDDMELALHEAVSNALVHGNLEVDGMKGLNMAALDRFSRELEQRMADPAFAGRRIEVCGWTRPSAIIIEVGDEGDGFAPAARQNHGASGRGLDLITAIARRCELRDGGRRIRMEFAL